MCPALPAVTSPVATCDAAQHRDCSSRVPGRAYEREVLREGFPLTCWHVPTPSKGPGHRKVCNQQCGEGRKRKEVSQEREHPLACARLGGQSR